MRYLTSLLLAALVVAVYPSASRCEGDPALKARVALALSQATHKLKSRTKPATCRCPNCSCDCCECTGDACYCPCCSAKSSIKKICSCGDSCKCKSGECGDPSCPSSRSKYPSAVAGSGTLEWAVYLIKYQKALAANKPLLIWVGETCPPCEARWTQYVHAHLSEYNGETGPEVIVAKEDGLGGMTITGRIDGIPTASQIKRLLDPPPIPVSTGSVGAQIGFAPPQPVFMPMPMMMPMMGGFGGGGMMMGGGGGGC